MKKLFLFVITITLPFLTGCDDFLKLENYTRKDSSSFPRNAKDVQEMLTGVYSSYRGNASGYHSNSEYASDHRFGGGGINDRGPQATDHLLLQNVNSANGLMTGRYTGISRANAVIDAIENINEGGSLDHMLGEAKVMRAGFYFELAKLFGDVPMLRTPPENVQEAQSSPPLALADDVYKYITSDLWAAYNMLPARKWDTYVSGTITRWAAAGLLARVFLFYTGFYGKDALPTEEGGQVTRAQVVAALEDCMANSGHELVADYRSLWTYSNSVSKKDYPFAIDAQPWVKDGENPEHVMVAKNSPSNAYMSTSFDHGNCLSYSMRANPKSNYDHRFPMGMGWGMGPVNSVLWDEWVVDEPNDIRRKGSIWNYKEETYFEGTGENRREVSCEDSYNENQWGSDQQMNDTGMWQKKYCAIRAYKPDGSLWWSFMADPEYYNNPVDHYQQGHGSDLIVIRYADILLMHSEITKTAEGMNLVRARANLPAITYSEDALRKERVHELSFEGWRWDDIRRWHIAEVELDKCYGVRINNAGKFTTMQPQGPPGEEKLSDRYRTTQGFFSISETQLNLAPDVLKQKPGWERSDLIYSGFKDAN